LFVCLLLPGICYVSQLERGARPSKSLTVSVFRETAAVVFASIVLLLLGLLLFSVLRGIWPQHTPNVGALERDWHQYVVSEREADYVAWWGLGLIAFACLVGFVVARFDLMGKVEDVVGDDNGSRSESAWWSAFQHAGKTHYNYLYCRLEDGSHIEGPLASFNPSPDETDDRSLQIGAPYTLRDGSGVVTTYDTGVIVVSSRRLSWMRVIWLSPEDWANWTGIDPG
jgi:hypothetical protein